MAALEKGATDPQQVVRPLLLQGNAGAHTRMHE